VPAGPSVGEFRAGPRGISRFAPRSPSCVTHAAIVGQERVGAITRNWESQRARSGRFGRHLTLGRAPRAPRVIDFRPGSTSLMAALPRPEPAPCAPVAPLAVRLALDWPFLVHRSRGARERTRLEPVPRTPGGRGACGLRSLPARVRGAVLREARRTCGSPSGDQTALCGGPSFR
jgi:hypothetical protein